MAQIATLTLSSNDEIVQKIRARLHELNASITFIADNAPADRADAALIIIGTDWQEVLEQDAHLQRNVAAVLQRSDLLALVVFIDGQQLPPAAELAPDLQAMAYLHTVHIADESEVERGAYAIFREVFTHLQRVSPISAQVAPAAVAPTGRRSRGGVPLNVIFIVLIISAALLLLAISRLRPQTSPQTQAITIENLMTYEIVRLGLAAGLSEGSEIRGLEMVNGVELALIDRASITIGGQTFPVDLIIHDDLCSATGGLNAAQDFANDESLLGVIGHLCDTSCSAAAPVYNRAGLAMISPGCTLARLTPNNPNFNRTIPSADYVAVPAAEIALNQLGLNRAAIVHDEIILGGELAAQFQTHFTQQGGQVAGFYNFVTTTADFDQIVSDLLSGDPQFVYYAGRAANAAEIKQRLDEAEPDIAFVLADPDTTVDYIALAGESAEGTYVVTLLPPAGEAFDALTNHYTDVYGIEPTTPVYAYAYDATNLLLDSIESLATPDEDHGFNLNREQLRDTIRAYEGEGVTGALICAEMGNCATAGATAFIVQIGELMEVPTP